MREKREQVLNTAKENFKNGLNCAECVFDALMRNQVLNLPPQTIGMCVGFGGGMGLSGYTCGALSAAVMAVGAVHGRHNPWAVPAGERGHQIADKYYRRYNRMLHDFRAANKGVLCREICSPYEWADKERRKQCLNLIGATAALAFDYIMMPQDEAFTLPYGDNMGGLS